jgi:putative nucleotidyltransferase with HDIG domain
MGGINMKKEIIKLIPEINLIENADLKEKVVKTLETALMEGGFTVSDLHEMPFTLLTRRVFISMTEHVRTVVRLCLESFNILSEIYGQRLRLNRDILLAGAVLHDVGKFVEFVKEKGKFIKSRNGELLRHPFSGMAIAARCGIPDEVLHIIAVHSKEGDTGRRTPEAIILHHADFISFETVE